MPVVEIKISRDGKTVEIEGLGFEGTGCAAVQEAFETLGVVEDANKKPEYFANETETISI